MLFERKETKKRAPNSVQERLLQRKVPKTSNKQCTRNTHTLDSRSISGKNFMKIQSVLIKILGDILYP